MTGFTENRILVAVDGSEHSAEMVRYVGKTLPSHRSRVVLFHVVANLPQSFYDFEKDSAYHYKIISTSEWEAQQQEVIRNFMDQTRRILLDAGFAEDSVSITVQIRKVGIARDIMEESQKGYDTVVVGRKGLSQLKDLVLGGTAAKLIENLAHVPVWIVDGKSQQGKILVCLDTSQGAMQAADYVGRVLGGSSGFEVTLLHVLPEYEALPTTFGEAIAPGLEQEWIEEMHEKSKEAEEVMKLVFETARARLQKVGFDPKQVNQKIIKGADKPAGTIMEEAQQGGYDTIVLGRRGLSRMQEFFMGRVSNKVIDLAKDRAVWVVS